MLNTRNIMNVLLTLGTLTLLGCNSGGGNNQEKNKTVSLTGTAAVGAAITNGTLVAKCADGSGFTQSVLTEVDGSWSGSVSSAALPCALQISGGTPNVTLHSLAMDAGVTNITPLTDLAMALATSEDPSTWFSGFNGSSVNIDTATDSLLDQLDANDFTIPATGNPFTTPFTADGSGWDALLDEIGIAIEEDVSLSDYNALLTLVRDGQLASLPDAPPPPAYTISGSITGANSNVIWETIALGGIYHDGGNGNGSVTFTYGDGLERGTEWSVVVNSEPAGQNCSVSNGSGTLTADVTNVLISCEDEPD